MLTWGLQNCRHSWLMRASLLLVAQPILVCVGVSWWGHCKSRYQGNLLLKSKKGRLVALSGHLNLPSTASLWCSPGCLPELISLFSRVACQNEEWQTWPWEEYGSVIRTGLVSAWHPSGLTQRCWWKDFLSQNRFPVVLQSSTIPQPFGLAIDFSVSETILG